jgi:hypothetical protein
MQYIRQSTASQEISLGYFLDPTDGNTEETALTIANTDIKIRKHGAITLVNKNSGGATHISNGIYQCTLDATDTNTAGMLDVYVHVSGALAVKSTYVVLTATAFDALLTGTFNNLGGTAQTGDTYALANGATGFSAIDTVVDAILLDTAEIGTAGAGLTNINLPNQSMDIVGNITGNLSGSVGSVTGHTPQTGDSFARIGAAGAGLTNIGTIATVTNLTNLPTIPTNWLTAAGIAASAMNGKGDWNIGKTGYSISGAITTLDGLNNFNPTTDAVANVTLVATTTTNTDMRGTDSAGTSAALSTAQAAIDAVLVDTSTTIPAQITALNNISVADVLTTAMTEAYAADGVAPTLAQAIFIIKQNLEEFSFSGVTKTVKKIDGTTTAATYTLDDAATPTSNTRAS